MGVLKAGLYTDRAMAQDSSTRAGSSGAGLFGVQRRGRLVIKFLSLRKVSANLRAHEMEF